MGVVREQGVKATVIAYIGVLLGTFNTLWLYPKLLDEEEIGLMRLVVDMALLLSSYGLLGSRGIIIKFFPKFKDDNTKYGSFLFLTFLVPFLGAILISAVILIFKDIIAADFQEKSPEFVKFLFVLLPLTLILMGRDLMIVHSKALYKIAFPKFLTDVANRIFMAVLIIVYSVFSFTTDFFIFGIMAIYGLVFLIMIWYYNSLKPIRINTSLKPIGKGLLKEMMVYGGFIIMGSVSVLIVNRIDIYMISSELGLSFTGVYTIALFIGTVIEIPKRAISQISLTVVSQAWENNDRKMIQSLYSKSALNQFIFGGLLLILIWINIDDIFSVMPNGDIYSKGKYVVLFIGLSKLIDISTGINHEIILTSKYYKAQLVIMVFLIGIAILLNYLLISEYGITGAAIATMLSILIYNLAKYVFVWAKLQFQCYDRNILIALVIAGLAFLLGYSLPTVNNSLISIGYKSIVVSLFFVPAIYFSKVSEDINMLILGTLRYLLRKKK